jgi:esterase/lipase
MRLLKLVLKILFVLVVLQLARGWISRIYINELQPWHRVSEEKELNYDDYKDVKSYLKDEKLYLEKLYREVEVHENDVYNRYVRNSISSPFSSNGENRNVSFEMIPKEIKGGVLLIHGLTDSPFTMRDIGQIFYEKGYYVFAIRFPYHGTHPGEMLKLNWKDFVKATNFGAKMVNKKLKTLDNPKFYMVGYSTGASATLQYITNEIKVDKELPKPDGIFWLSPAMGVTPAAKYGFLDIWLSKIPGFEKFAWLDNYPEYDPAKYNSFPKNAGIQVYNIIKNARKNLDRLSEEEKKNLPPIYTYTSIEDATVDTSELVNVLRELKNENGEVVIFDANRKYNEFYKPEIKDVDLAYAIENTKINSEIVVITNYDHQRTDTVSVNRYKNNKWSIDEGWENRLKWSESSFSLAHISLPISSDNMLYGKGTAMGTLNIKGENGLVYLSPSMMIRLRYNIFFEYIEEDMKNKI